MHEMFIQTEEQKAILETVKKFVDDVVKPVSVDLDGMGTPEERYLSLIHI